MLFTLFHPFSNFHKKFMQCNMQYSVCIELKNSLKSIYKYVGKNPNPKDQLAQWVKRGFITYDETTKKYRKTQKYLSSRAA